MLSRCAATVGCKTQSYCHNIVAPCVWACVCVRVCVHARARVRYLLSSSLQLITELMESQHWPCTHTHAYTHIHVRVCVYMLWGLTWHVQRIWFHYVSTEIFFFWPSTSCSVCSSVLEDLRWNWYLTVLSMAISSGTGRPPVSCTWYQKVDVFGSVATGAWITSGLFWRRASQEMIRVYVLSRLFFNVAAGRCAFLV